MVAGILSGCTTQPSLVDSSVVRATPEQFVAPADQDVLERAHEQRVRHRSDELYRTGQAKTTSEANKRARDELGVYAVNATEPVKPTSASKPALNQKSLDAAAQEVSRQRSR
jgi:hypothetical protein